ncbi:MAG: EamA family transporter [Actinomycetota bacterium]|nr:EamA family transporter [Actinomycetota bacterium]
MLASLALIILSISFAVSGQLCLKVGMNSVGRISASHLSNLGGTIVMVATTPLVVLGLFLYVIAASIWLVVLSRVDLSFAYPMLGLSYVMVLIISSIFLRENVTALRWLGTFVICFGVFLITRT